MTITVKSITNVDPVRVKLVLESNTRVRLDGQEPEMRAILKPDKPSLKISLQNDNGVLNNTGAGVTLVSSAGSAVNRLDAMLDVVEDDPEDNSTLVYDKATDTYVVKPISLDGGTF